MAKDFWDKKQAEMDYVTLNLIEEGQIYDEMSSAKRDDARRKDDSSNSRFWKYRTFQNVISRLKGKGYINVFREEDNEVPYYFVVTDDGYRFMAQFSENIEKVENYA